MPRYSLRALLLSVTLLAGGFCLMGVAFQPNTVTGDWGEALCGLGGSARFGAGLMTPFGKPWIGAAAGIGILLLLTFMAASIFDLP